MILVLVFLPKGLASALPKKREKAQASQNPSPRLSAGRG
jgi:hypothetical protein